MKIKKLSWQSYEIPLTDGGTRQGLLLQIEDENKKCHSGDVAPLPKFSGETLDEALNELHQKRQKILEIDWTLETCLEELEKLQLLPSVSFGLESALLSLLSPIGKHSITTSALLMGSPDDILRQAALKAKEGFVSAKLKVSTLTFDAAAELIHQLKDRFRLRIDVNRAWKTDESLRFFEQFPLDSFDYVEEPFQNPLDLHLFPHPLAVDESFPQDLSLKQLESFKTLKALIYKPTIQGGMVRCLPLKEWADKRGVMLVLSSSFESDVGLQGIASMAHRLALTAPIGIGTYSYLEKYLCSPPLQFSGPLLHID